MFVNVIRDDKDKYFAEGIAFDGDGFDVPLDLAAVPISIDLVANLNPTIPQELVPVLLQGEGFILHSFVEGWGSKPFAVMLEKQLVASINPLNHILHCLSINRLPILATAALFSNVSH